MRQNKPFLKLILQGIFSQQQIAFNNGSGFAKLLI